MSRERRLLKDLLALLLLTLCPMQAIAQDDEWVRVDVFGGRASVEVPKSYKASTGEVPSSLLNHDLAGVAGAFHHGVGLKRSVVDIWR